MPTVIKLFLIGTVLLACSFCGGWYVMTPQPPGLKAQWGFFSDAMIFQARHFKRLPNMDFTTPSNITQGEADAWLAEAYDGNRVASLAVARYLFGQGQKNPRAYVMAIELLQPLADEGLPQAHNALGVAYRYGLGVPMDQVQAVAHFIFAGGRGLRLAQDNLYQLSREITADQMHQAKERSRLL